MSFPVANVNISTDTFSVWVTRTNQLLDALSRYTVTVDNAGSNVTVGSGYVTGTFGGNTVVATQGIRGGNTTVTSNLTLLSNTSVLGTLRANSSVILSNTLNVSGTATLSANLNVSGNTNISNTLNVTGNTNISGTLNVVGTSSLNNTLNVVGNTNISNTLIVSGNTTINNILSISGNTNISNTLNVTGNTNIGGNLTVSGDTNILGNFSFTGSNLVFSSNVTFANTAGIIANGSLGSNGTVLFSNGSGLYWDTIVIPLVIGNNGIISNTSGLFVNANTGLSVNATGVYVNPSYIATIASNSATFANSSVTNTFTVGTASYFVANGNLGIGNTSPVYKLRVDGTISLSGGVHANGSLGSSSQALFSNGTGVYWADVVGGAVLTANNTDTQTFYIPMSNATSGSWSNGVVANTKLYFVPSTGTLNATIFNSLSDETKKTDVVSIQSALDKVLDMRGVEFRWSDNGELSSGVIAQEIEPILPHLVKTDQLGTKSVHYDGLIPYLLEAIKELNEKVKRLENG